MAHNNGYVVTAGQKKASQPSWNWVLINETGGSKALDVDKYAVMDRVQIHARDLRILDPNLSSPSTILCRERAIVLNLEHIKAIITSDEVLLRDPSDENVIPVVKELERHLPVGNKAHHGQGEGKDSLVAQNDADAGEEDAARTTELETAAYPALDELASKMSSHNLDRVRKLKSATTRLTARVQKVRDELAHLMDDDEDMADLYLSRKLSSASSAASSPNCYLTSPTIGFKVSRASVGTVHGDENDVEQLEMLLEAYFMQIDSTFNKLTTLREYIDDTDDYINIHMDNHRNQLIQLEVVLSSGTVCSAFYSLVAGIFGMNIPYTWNDNHGYMFKWVCIVTGAICVISLVFIMSYARFKGLVGS
ncbi:hypothetical protein Bca52824_029747 [Brassica carinata]|uniref:Magnesium transporter n=1 Tax=Brassica carinata TaxID=52824 RepID=A0A8X7V4X0_BRACI|nr:hypothetical protein Bca52824_029747 [Brassica carinata]